MKKLLKWLKGLSVVTAFCGLLSVGCLLYDQTNHEVQSVSAEDEVLIEYNYDYRYMIQKYDVTLDSNYVNYVANHVDGYIGLYEFTFRMVLHYNDSYGYKISFDNMSLHYYYGKYFSRDGNTENYLFYLQHDYGGNPYFLDDINLDYESELSYFRNTNHYYTIYLDFNYYDDTGALNVGLVFKKGTENYSDGTRITVGLIEDFDDYRTGSTGGLVTDFNQHTELITFLNPLSLGEGIDTAISTAFSDGISGGAQEMWEQGYLQGKADGYQNGYTVGYNEGFSSDSTVTSIFSGILQVALVPINFFLAIFNFEILGINLSGFIRALFTVAIVVIIIKTIFGGKGASDS